jgi:AcrR family transcriptional regulator
VTTAGDALLARVIDDVAVNGLGDRSLRDLAAAVGTSHRLVLYHFESRAGLVRAIVEHIEADQRQAFMKLVGEASSTGDLIRRLWKQVSQPTVRPFVRLFFELASYVEPGSDASPDSKAIALTAPWLADSKAASKQLGINFDPVDVRLGIAVVRGLLLDVLAGEQRQATRSLERFIITMWPDTQRPQRPPGAAQRRRSMVAK